MKRTDLVRLYRKEKKTLQEIGIIYGLTRERIRQVMQKMGIPRYTKRAGGKRFKNLAQYLKNGGATSTILARLQQKRICQECGSQRNLHIHHLRYPATQISDIQVLCASCHHTKHRKNTDIHKQLGICVKYIQGKHGPDLAKEYNLHVERIYQILRKWNIKRRHARDYDYPTTKDGKPISRTKIKHKT